MRSFPVLAVVTALLGVASGVAEGQTGDLPTDRSHPPLRRVPPVAGRPRADGPGRAYFADPVKGDDAKDGSERAPWRTVNHALAQLKAGDTLYLRGGVYYENVYLALVGRKDAPVTIRSAPGEQAVIDGGFREFFADPARSWEPAPGGTPGEYRSTGRYPNLREVLGSFGDSLVGLQTYYHAQDFRSANELIDWQDWDNTAGSDLKPLYVGPGLWYDRDSGRIHVRLAHTHLPEPVPNYRGVTDPRLLPLVIASYRSIPLHVDQAKHVRVQDLVLRGAGETTLRLDQAADVEFDNVTVWCGSYGIQADGTGPLRLYRCGLYGNVAPWTFRSDGSKRDYPGRPHRNLSRLNTHALLEIDAGRESSVYATPYNDRWEISYCDFCNAHDGVYLGAINVRFHHNLIEDLQDDGIYLSPMYRRHRLEKTDPELHIYKNVIRQVLTAFAFGGPEPVTTDAVHIYRNVVDLRAPVPTGRPSTRKAEPSYSRGHVMGDHGSPPWSAMNIYHNTFVMADPARDAGMGTLGGNRAGLPRRVFNNIYLHLARLPGYVSPDPKVNAVEDGNLFWSPAAVEKVRATFFQKYRKSASLAESQKLYAPGTAAHSQVADPLFRRANAEPNSDNDYGLRAGSPAIDAGVPLPDGWRDVATNMDRGRPDIGALWLGAPDLRVGRAAARGTEAK